MQVSWSVIVAVDESSHSLYSFLLSNGISWLVLLAAGNKLVHGQPEHLIKPALSKSSLTSGIILRILRGNSLLASSSMPDEASDISCQALPSSRSTHNSMLTGHRIENAN